MPVISKVVSIALGRSSCGIFCHVCGANKAGTAGKLFASSFKWMAPFNERLTQILWAQLIQLPAESSQLIKKDNKKFPTARRNQVVPFVEGRYSPSCVFATLRTEGNGMKVVSGFPWEVCPADNGVLVAHSVHQRTTPIAFTSHFLKCLSQTFRYCRRCELLYITVLVSWWSVQPTSPNWQPFEIRRKGLNLGSHNRFSLARVDCGNLSFSRGSPNPSSFEFADKRWILFSSS
jgi:hypothetical protein